MRRGELLEFAQRLREQQIAENKAGLRELIAKDVEEFLKGGGAIRQVYGSYEGSGRSGDAGFTEERDTVVTTPLPGTTGDNYARGREILRKKREKEKQRKALRMPHLDQPHDGGINA